MARTPDPDTEKLKRQVIFMLQPSLYAEFEVRCRAQYKTVSGRRSRPTVAFAS